MPGAEEDADLPLGRQGAPEAPQRRALALFLVQLAFNALWSWLFFGWHMGGPAFAEVLLLWGLILALLFRITPRVLQSALDFAPLALNLLAGAALLVASMPGLLCLREIKKREKLDKSAP